MHSNWHQRRLLGIAFDLDGTLVDSLPDLAAAGNRMLLALDRPPVALAQVRDYIGDGIAVLVHRLVAGRRDAEHSPLAQRAMDLFMGYYAEELVVRSKPFPGVMDALRALQDRIPMACVTNKALAYTRPLLEGLGLHPYFQIVLGGDSLPKKKPDPLPFVHCAAQFNISTAELLVVGDSPNDCVAARAAGCPVVCVPYGYAGPGGVPGLDCDAIVTDLTELAAALLKKLS